MQLNCNLRSAIWECVGFLIYSLNSCGTNCFHKKINYFKAIEIFEKQTIDDILKEHNNLQTNVAFEYVWFNLLGVQPIFAGVVNSN